MRKRKLVLVVILATVGIAVIASTIDHLQSLPFIKEEEIGCIWQQRFPEQPDGFIESLTLWDEHAIALYVEMFNALDFEPVLAIRYGAFWPPLTGFYAKNILYRDATHRYVSIVYHKYRFNYLPDDRDLIQINNKYYTIGRNAFESLLDIVSRFGSI